MSSQLPKASLFNSICLWSRRSSTHNGYQRGAWRRPLSCHEEALRGDPPVWPILLAVAADEESAEAQNLTVTSGKCHVKWNETARFLQRGDANACTTHVLNLSLLHRKVCFMLRTRHINVSGATHAYQMSSAFQSLITSSMADISMRLSVKFNMSKTQTPNFSNTVTIFRQHFWGLEFNPLSNSDQ